MRSLWRLLVPPPKDRDGRIRRQIEGLRFLAGGNPIDEQAAAVFAATAVDRAYHPQGGLDGR